MTRMLASVTGLAEARLAVSAEVDWLDLKEPAAGALGAVAAEVICRVVEWTAGRCPVSATIGDCWTEPSIMPERVALTRRCGVDFVKVGLFAHRPSPVLVTALENCAATGAAVIAVCFAEDPPCTADLRLLATAGLAGVMLDTADKGGPGLTGLLSLPRLQAFVDVAKGLDLLSGLAGRLRLEDVPRLVPLAPDYLGFRGALCRDGTRENVVAAEAIAKIRERIDGCADSLRAAQV